jgi:TonB family protein
MRALPLIALGTLFHLAVSIYAAEPVMINKSQLIGGDIPKQYRPPYPYEARRRHQEGSGMFILHIDSKTGQVTSITVQKSTGYKLLDSAVLTACIHWRFKPHTVTDVFVPITFSMKKRPARARF